MTEDYFGFPVKKGINAGPHKLFRTQLSQQKLCTKSREKDQARLHGLKLKYSKSSNTIKPFLPYSKNEPHTNYHKGKLKHNRNHNNKKTLQYYFNDIKTLKHKWENDQFIHQDPHHQLRKRTELKALAAYDRLKGEDQLLLLEQSVQVGNHTRLRDKTNAKKTFVSTKRGRQVAVENPQKNLSMSIDRHIYRNNINGTELIEPFPDNLLLESFEQTIKKQIGEISQQSKIKIQNQEDTQQQYRNRELHVNHLQYLEDPYLLNRKKKSLHSSKVLTENQDHVLRSEERNKNNAPHSPQKVQNHNNNLITENSIKNSRLDHQFRLDELYQKRCEKYQTIHKKDQNSINNGLNKVLEIKTEVESTRIVNNNQHSRQNITEERTFLKKEEIRVIHHVKNTQLVPRQLNNLEKTCVGPQKRKPMQSKVFRVYRRKEGGERCENELEINSINNVNGSSKRTPKGTLSHLKSSLRNQKSSMMGQKFSHGVKLKPSELMEQQVKKSGHIGIPYKPYKTFQIDQLPLSSRYSLSQSIKEWSDFEWNRKNNWHDSMDQVLDEIIEKIELHLLVVNTIAEFVEMTDQVYVEDEVHWRYFANFLAYKGFYYQRVRISKCLKGELKQNGKQVSCFTLQDMDITNHTLKPYFDSQEIIQRQKDIQQCNKVIWKSLEGFYKYLRTLNIKNPLFNLEIFNENDLRAFFSDISEELEALLSRYEELDIWKPNEKEIKEVIAFRSFKIMEVVFLFSELRGRFVKSFQEDIQTDDFDQYFNENYPRFKETILHFS